MPAKEKKYGTVEMVINKVAHAQCMQSLSRDIRKGLNIPVTEVNESFKGSVNPRLKQILC